MFLKAVLIYFSRLRQPENIFKGKVFNSCKFCIISKNIYDFLRVLLRSENYLYLFLPVFDLCETGYFAFQNIFILKNIRHSLQPKVFVSECRLIKFKRISFDLSIKLTIESYVCITEENNGYLNLFVRTTVRIAEVA